MFFYIVRLIFDKDSNNSIVCRCIAGCFKYLFNSKTRTVKQQTKGQGLSSDSRKQHVFFGIDKNSGIYNE